MHILIFKTNIESEQEVKEIAPLLNSKTYLHTWSVDKEDVDKVLRIESSINNSIEIINTIKQAGFVCEELPD